MTSWLGEYGDWQQPASRSSTIPLVFIQGPVEEDAAVVRVCESNGMGAILTTSSSRGAASAKHVLSEAAHRHANRSNVPVALDVNRYAGRNRRNASTALDPSWIDQQLTAGATFALSDSGFVSDTSFADLDALFANARRLPYLETGRVRTVVAVSSQALSQRKYLREFEARLHDFEHPISLALEHSKDPLGSVRAVRGLLQVIEASADISLMRSDYSVFGAVAAGATFGAIGTKSSLRHIFPIPKKNGGGPASEDISIVWPQGLSFHRASAMAEVIAFDRDNPQWLCDCTACEGQSLERLTVTRRAEAHNLAVGSAVRDRLFPLGRSASSLLAWAEMCTHAQTLMLQLDEMESLAVPAYLGAWRAAIKEAARSN